MGKSLIYECDICKRYELKTSDDIPPNWFDMIYEYNNNSRQIISNEISYLVCSIRCYYLQMDRCLHYSQEHFNVKISGMSRHFVMQILKGVDIVGLEKKLLNNREYKSEVVKTEQKNNNEEEEQLKFIVQQKGKITSIKEWSSEKLNWLEKFAIEYNDDKLMNKCNSIWEHDNLITYDSLIDVECPKIPLIRYKNYYILFCYESLIPFYNELKQINDAA